AIVLTFEAGWFAYVGAEGPERTEQAWSLVSRLLVGWCVLMDRRARGVGMPFEFEAFVVFVWPFVLAYYLYRTRRAKGLLLALGFWLLSVAPAMVTDISRLVGS